MAESMADVFARLTRVADTIDNMPADELPDADALKPISIHAQDADGFVVVEMTDMEITDVQFNASWLRSKSPQTIERTLRDVLNDALRQAALASQEQLIALGGSFGDLTKNIRDLQGFATQATREQFERIEEAIERA